MHPGPLRSSRKAVRGFTLIEVLVTLVVVGVLASAITLALPHADARLLGGDARRLALDLQRAQRLAIQTSRPVSVLLLDDGYQLAVDLADGAVAPAASQHAHTQHFDSGAVSATISSRLAQPTSLPLHLRFGTEPVGEAFTLTLRTDSAIVSIVADGLGSFVVQ